MISELYCSLRNAFPPALSSTPAFENGRRIFQIFTTYVKDPYDSLKKENVKKCLFASMTIAVLAGTCLLSRSALYASKYVLITASLVAIAVANYLRRFPTPKVDSPFLNPGVHTPLITHIFDPDSVKRFREISRLCRINKEHRLTFRAIQAEIINQNFGKIPVQGFIKSFNHLCKIFEKCNSLKKLHFDYGLDDDMCEKLAKSAPHLTHLSIVRSIYADEKVISEQGWRALTSLQELEYLEIKGANFNFENLSLFKNLKYLKISRDRRLSSDYLEIQHMELISRLSQLQELELTDAFLSPIFFKTIAQCKNLVNLTLMSSDGFLQTSCEDKEIALIAQNLTSLHTLCIASCLVNDNVLKVIGENLTNLRYLNLILDAKATDEGLCHLKSLSHLETLTLQHYAGMKWTYFPELAKNFKKLTSLELECTEGYPPFSKEMVQGFRELNSLTDLKIWKFKVTKDDLQAIVECLPNLRTLDITFCELSRDFNIDLFSEDYPQLEIDTSACSIAN